MYFLLAFIYLVQCDIINIYTYLRNWKYSNDYDSVKNFIQLSNLKEYKVMGTIK